jgi:predicted nucleic acid-binding protein
VIVLDTNVVVSAADTDEPRHGACAELLRRHRAELVLPTTVVVESSWFIEDRLGPGAEAKFLRSVTSGELRRQDLTDTDWERATGLIEAYADLGLGLVDASVVAIAERLGATTIATLNHRDFMVVRPRHIVAFELLP